MSEREFAIEVVRTFQEAGYQALWAGGCVRDELLGLPPKDYDVATDARPEQVRRLFRRTVAVGESFGVVEVLGPRDPSGPLKVQVATFRADSTYSDGRRPDEVTFSSAREDALRRDFSINGMFFDPLADRLLDYVGGRADLDARILRAIGNPHARFAEDKLRLLRAARFASRFALTIDPGTAAAVRAMAGEIGVVSAERIAEELRRLLTDPRRAEGIRLLGDLGLIAPLLPELLALKETPDDCWGHTLRTLDRLGAVASFPLALAALLHGVGRRATVAVAERLRLANAERDRAVWLVEKYQDLRDPAALRRCELKKVLVHPGIGELLALHRADALADGWPVEHVSYCEERLREWSASGELDPPPVLTGDDLKRRGLEPGPRFKKLLTAVRDAQLDGTITDAAGAGALVDRLLAEGM